MYNYQNKKTANFFWKMQNCFFFLPKCDDCDKITGKWMMRPSYFKLLVIFTLDPLFSECSNSIWPKYDLLSVYGDFQLKFSEIHEFWIPCMNFAFLPNIFEFSRENRSRWTKLEFVRLLVTLSSSRARSKVGIIKLSVTLHFYSISVAWRI